MPRKTPANFRDDERAAFICVVPNRTLTIPVALCGNSFAVVWAALSIGICSVAAGAVESGAAAACHFSDADLSQILGDEYSATSGASLTFKCAGHYLYIDVAPAQPAVKLSLGLPVDSVQDSYPFAGLASYYTSVRAVKLEPNGSVAPLELPAASIALTDDTWAGMRGRYNVFMVSAPGAKMTIDKQHVGLQWPADAQAQVRVFLGQPGAAQRSPGSQPQNFTALRYSHLWNWLAALCLGIEKLLLLIHGTLTASWGIAIIALAIAIKLLLLPVSLLTAKLQDDVNRYHAQLEPRLSEIKAKFDGEEAHRLIMAEYKAVGVTPFFTLKPMLGILIQLPVLVATFNVLGEMPQLQGQAFLWVSDLAYPDSVATLPVAIPTMGADFNLMPFVMTLVTLLATVNSSVPHASAAAAGKQKRNLYLMCAVFFFLFYPFPAAMVLYWTLANALQFIQQRAIRG